MVLEALAAVGLAANILQFVEFSYDLVTGAREIRNSSTGMTAENDALELIADDLSRLSQTFIAQASSEASSLSAGDNKISNIALSSKQVSDELLAAVRRLKSDNRSHRKWHSFRRALKVILKKEEINNLAKKLEGLRDQLSLHAVSRISDYQTELLPALKSLNNQCEGIDLHQKDKITPLLRALVEIAEEHRDLSKAGQDEIRLLLSSSQEAIKLRKEVNILKSLTFDMMKARYSVIPEAHAKTLEWIFEPSRWPQSDPRSQIRFYEWLQYKNGLFWVSGKPGSGKSTLMKYIVDCVRTEQCLREWAAGARFAIPSFYFWISGSEMQRSERGLLQQLLFEVLKAFPDLMPLLCPDRWEQRHHDMQMEWSLLELRQAFGRLKTTSACTFNFSKICFFIDGLDEYDGDHLDLIKTIKSIAHAPNMKICVSSRPWNHFKDAFGKNPDRRLYLQDLTREDMATYAREKLAEAATATIIRMKDTLCRQLIRDIVDRAQGVFLWVYLVVRSLRAGLNNGDSISLLRERLLEFPSDLEEFFKKLIESVDKVYRKYMAYTFQVALRAPRALLLVMYSFLEEDELNTPSWDDAHSKQPLDLRSLEEATRHKLNGRYKGLLESVEVPGESPRVDFLHRTVRDFLNTKDMCDLLFLYSGHTSKALLHGCRAFSKLRQAYPRIFREPDFDDFINIARQVQDDKVEGYNQLIEVLEEMSRAMYGANAPTQMVLDKLWDKDTQPYSLLGKAIHCGIFVYARYKFQMQPYIVSMNSGDALELALCPHSGDYCPEMVALLLKYGANPTQNWTAVHKFLLNYPLGEPLSIDRLQKWRMVLSLLIQGEASVGLEFACWVSQMSSDLCEVDSRNSSNSNLKLEIKESVLLFIEAGSHPNQTVTLYSHHPKHLVTQEDTPWKVLLDSANARQVAASIFLSLIELFLQRGADPHAQICEYKDLESWLCVLVPDVISSIGNTSSPDCPERQAAEAALEAAIQRHAKVSHDYSGQAVQTCEWFPQNTKYLPRDFRHHPESSLEKFREIKPDHLPYSPLLPNQVRHYRTYTDWRSLCTQPMEWQLGMAKMREVGPVQSSQYAITRSVLAQQRQWTPPAYKTQQQDQ